MDRHNEQNRISNERSRLRAPDRKLAAASVILLAALTVAAFSPAFRAKLINWDDTVFITKNEVIKELSLTNVKKMFTEHRAERLFIPLVWLSYALEIALFGENPTVVFHTVNLLLHIANVFLVLFLIYKLTGNYPVSLITAAFFALHPTRVESVVWVTERKDVLSTFFMLGALVFYVSYLRDNRRLSYSFSLLSFILAAMSKPMVVTVPALMMLIDYFAGEKFLSKRRLLEKIPFFCISLLLVYVTIELQKGRIKAEHAAHIGASMMIAADNIVFYLSKLFAPVGLSILYPVPEAAEAFSAEYFFSLGILIVLCAGVMISARRTKYIVFGFLFFIISILPVIQIVPVGMQNVADRFSYVPYIGLFLIVAWGADLLIKKSRSARERQTIFAALVLLVLVGAFLSYLRANLWAGRKNMPWSGSIALWEDARRQYPSNPIILNQLAHALFCEALELPEDEVKEEVMSRAEALLLEAAGLDKNLAGPYYNLGSLARQRGRMDEARKFYEMSVAVDPKFFDGYESLAALFEEGNDTELAIKAYEKCVELRPWSDRYYVNLGNQYQKIGNYERAIYNFNRALEKNPENSFAHFNSGRTYMLMGNLDRAIDEFERTIALAPDEVEAHALLGSAYREQGRLKEALKAFETALRLGPPAQMRYMIEKDIKELREKIRTGN